MLEANAERVGGTVQSHFLDSGAFTLRTTSVKWGQENSRPWRDFYETDEFWKYMDDYAAFIKEHQVAIDLYANVDVIPDPELTYRNQKYLEKKHHLSPVPVVHYPTDVRWLERYIDEGYELIGLGGLVRKDVKLSKSLWLDRCFRLICDNTKHLPIVKIHGFGVTNYPMLIRYPWWSVDSVTWAKVGGFGGILVPHKRKGQFTFDEIPYKISMSRESKGRDHYWSMSPQEQEIIREWLEFIGVPLGKIVEGEVVEEGVVTRHTERRLACLLFFEKLREWLPKWPWPYNPIVKRGEGFGLVL